MIAAGTLTERVLVLAPVQGRTAKGSAMEAFKTHAEVRARREVSGGREFAEAQKRWASLSALFTVRWRGDIVETMRLVHAGRTYRIVAPPYRPDSWKDRDRLLIPCEEVR